VALTVRDEHAFDLVAGELDKAGANALAVPTKVGEPAAVAALIEHTVACFGRLDIACNNAAARRQPADATGRCARTQWRSEETARSLSKSPSLLRRLVEAVDSVREIRSRRTSWNWSSARPPSSRASAR
jgi:NAD(P)-dependent dehydrogenase (short-subunit alcohol dehydrogenase family)